MVKIKGVDKIGHVPPSPMHHFVGYNAFISSRLQPLFHEQDLRVVVCPLGEHAVPTSPWRDHIERQSKP